MATNPGSLAPPPGLPSAPTLPPTSCCNHKYSPLQIGSATCRVLCLAGCVHCLPGTPENPLPPSRGIQGRLNVEATRPRLPRSSERHPKLCVARHCFPTPRSAPGVWRACCKCVSAGPPGEPPTRPDGLSCCRDGLPYCEADYHTKFGIRCDGCEKYITGHVLEAGEKHYHPLCALCVRCGRMFAEGEEMYLQGSSIWHPACRQAARTEDRNKVASTYSAFSLLLSPFQETRSSSESIISAPASSTSGSPSRVIYAKLGDEILDYRDLAALPKSKAIYNIDRPDMISYSPYISHSVAGRQSCHESPQVLSPTPTEGDQDDRSYKQCRTSSPSSTGSVSLGRYTPTSRSPQHHSRPAGTVSVGTSSCLSLSQHPSPTSVFRHHYIPYFRGSESGRSTPSLSVLSDSKPPPCTYQQAPRHFHVPDTGVKDNIYRKPPIYKQHAVRRPDGEDGIFEQDNRKKTSWLILKGDADTRTNSPDLDSQSLSHSSGTDRDTLQTMQGDSFYSRFPYSKSDPLPGHGKNGLDHRNANLAPCGADPDASWGTRGTRRGDPCGSLAGAGVTYTFPQVSF
uniref:Actin binding LIM protein family member 2 n=1 Tax=Ursus americanus TaxID=9643 RepID=A0A452RFR1_URSAM